MKVQVGKWGNSLAIRLPQSIAAAAGIVDGALLDASVEGTEVMLRRMPIRPTLNELLAGMTDDNLHGETDWGAPRGDESW